METLSHRAGLISSLALISASPAFAQQPADSGVDLIPTEVTVTARRQKERAQDVPISLSVLSGGNLEEKGTYTLEDVQRQIPSVVAFNSNPRNSSVGIRGIGVSTASDGLDTSVGFYFDGVYLGRPGMALSDLIDIESFEVLRGPQGTLFGRNTSAGVINVTTRKPSFTPNATVEGSFGNYSYNQLKASVTGPLVDELLAFRLTAAKTKRDGVLDNETTGIDANSIDRNSIRGQLLLTPTPDLSFRLIGEYSDENDTCCVSVQSSVFPLTTGGTTARTLRAFASLGYSPTADFDSTLNNAPQDMRTNQHAFSLEADWNWGWADVTSISAYRYWHFDPLQDSDGTPLDIIQVNVATTSDTQVTQEFRLASKPGRFNWQVGAYAFHQELSDHYILNQFGTDAGAFYTAYLRTANPAAAAVTIAPGSQYIGDTWTESDAYAGFGQANFDLTDRVTLTGGLRYTKDRRTGVSDTSTVGTPYAATSIPFHHDQIVKGNNTSYLLSPSFKLTPDALLYLSYATGYKAAGLNLNSPVAAGTSIVVQPEKVKNWEIGLKQTLFNERATVNVNAFWLDLAGLQANILPPGVRSYLANVGDVRSRGIEGEASWKVTESLDWSVNGSLIDAKYRTYPNAPCQVDQVAPCDLSGKALLQSPKYIANTTARYHRDRGEGASPYGLVQFAYRSKHYGNVQLDDEALIHSYSLVNARVGAKFKEARYDVALWVDNAFDKVYFQSLANTSIVGAGAFGFSGRLGAPRTVGVTLNANF
jgi:iron complex outermembrane receptor protein